MMRAELTQSQIVIAASACDFIDLSATPWRRITLSARDNVWCLVDAIDFDWLSARTWNVSWGSRTPWQLYAKRNIGRDRATLRMHREIMIAADPRAEDFMAEHPVDHGNGQTLDNRRTNLAWVTPAQNQANKRPRAKLPSLDAIVLQLMAEHGYAPAQEVPF
jgi:hypothetical protein